MTRTVLVATWGDGLFVVTGKRRREELAGPTVNALAPDGHGGALAIVSGHSLRRRTSDGEWRTLATSEFQLACCAPVADAIYVGTDDARVLRASANGDVKELRGFETIDGRDTWYAGSVAIDGQRFGPPLGVRSLAATADGRVLLANVHVGGIPRSIDKGATWQPTIDINTDVHEVCTHPTNSDLVIAATGNGFHVSHDGGATWEVANEGLDVLHCSAAAFIGDDDLVRASTHQFADEGGVYRRRTGTRQPFTSIGGGLPRWIEGIADTRCIATRGPAAAIADRAGNLYVSADAAHTWLRSADGLPPPSSVVIV